MSDTTIVRNQMTRRSFAGPGKPAGARSGSAPRPGRSTAITAELDEAERIFKMPTVDEVVAAGYAPERWNEIKKKRDELVRRFRSDPAFRAEVLEDRQRRPYQE